MKVAKAWRRRMMSHVLDVNVHVWRRKRISDAPGSTATTGFESSLRQAMHWRARDSFEGEFLQKVKYRVDLVVVPAVSDGW